MGTMRDAILAAEDLPREKVQTDEWAPSGVPFVYVRGLTGAEREEYERSLQRVDTQGRVRANPRAKHVRTTFLVRVIVDENGERIFTDEDVKLLDAKSSLVLERLWDAGRKLSGMTTPEEEEEANPSTGDQEDSDSSDSP